MTQTDKLPQNIQGLIGEIGEKLTVLHLYFLVRGTPWQVFENLSSPGYDVLVSNPVSRESVRIEVKSRQRLHTTSKRPGTVHYTMSDLEHESCDFLAAYLLDQNAFYIIPREDLMEAHSGTKTLWKFILTLAKSGQAHPRFSKYRDAWHTIHSDFGQRSGTAAA